MTQPSERRHFWRAHFHSPVHLLIHGQAAEATLWDISLKGALIEVPPDWPGKTGDACQLILHLGSDAAIRMDAWVNHVDNRRVGLHCERIDLDSVTHLRRLVELNAGDPDILDRELSALLADTD